jgi:hypothetical protein
MVMFDVPAAVGVPDRTPALLKVNPVGSVPEVTLKVYGTTPPVALIVAEYAVPTTPLGSVAGDKLIVGQVETVIA